MASKSLKIYYYEPDDERHLRFTRGLKHLMGCCNLGNLTVIVLINPLSFILKAGKLLSQVLQTHRYASITAL